jgi:hypothetical protein
MYGSVYDVDEAMRMCRRGMCRRDREKTKEDERRQEKTREDACLGQPSLTLSDREKTHV